MQVLLVLLGVVHHVVPKMKPESQRLTNFEHRRALLLALCALALAALLWPPKDVRGHAALAAQAASLDADWIGRRVPPMQFRTLRGETLSLDALRGKVVMLNLFATWCPPCRQEFPSMLRLLREMQAQHQDFVMVVLSWDQQLDELQSYLLSESAPDSLIVGLDPDGELSRQLGTRLLPETFIIDRDGTMLYRMQNARDWDADRELSLFRKLLAR